MIEASKHGITGIVLAGGLSRRMGTDKGLVRLDDIEMTLSAINLLIPFCSNILISANQPGYENWGYPVIPDIHIGQGPLAGIHASMKASSSSRYIVLSCDLPFMVEQVIRQLLSQDEDADAIVPVHDDKLEPLCAIYHRNALPVVERSLASDKKAVRGIFKYLQVNYVDMTDLVASLPIHPFFNVNTAEDLMEVKQLLRNKATQG